jgi:magnesium transporter
MIERYKTGSLTWVDLNCPTAEEIRQVASEYHIHPLVAHELSIPTLRPKVDLYDNLIYLILHFPSAGRGDGVSDQEVDFVIGRDFIVTARYGEVDALLAFSKAFEVESILEKGSMGKHAGYIFFAMVNRIYDTLLHRIEGLKEDAAVIESEIFKGKERDMVMKISEVSRELLDFKRATSLHNEILQSFEVAGQKFFGDDFRFHLKAIMGNYFKLENSINNTMEFISELRETNNALLTTKQNSIVQVLTVIAFIALPLTIITSLFQIDTKARPIVGLPYDFWIIAGIQVLIALVMYLLFKMKKWL